MFGRILIANRGEVAARIIRTATRMGIETVGVATEADLGLGFLADATRVVSIGGPRAYLDPDVLIDVGLENRCSAVHPGWGFLSENPTFASRCEAARISFIGPKSSTMRKMADKAEARRTMAKLGVPTIPGGEGFLQDGAHAKRMAEEVGYPVLLKAVSGGGGRGMRIVTESKEIEAAFQEASAEALGAFGDGRVYLEKLIESARHVEFQVVGDGHRVQVLGERECSIQRRHQKLLEETPSPGLAQSTNGQPARAIAEQVQSACEALGYSGAGTVEMLATPDGGLYFMEMNTRLQVEHTVTEMVTGLDLVELQLRVAANESLPDLSGPTGHAIQCRINAEEVSANFRPTPGPIDALDLPDGEGIRVDTHLREGDRISPHYDSMIAKVIAHGSTRAVAIERMIKALAEMRVEGVPTTIGLHQRILSHPEFVAGNADTGFIDRELGALLA